MICVKCASPYGEVVNTKQGHDVIAVRWQCRKCGHIQPWEDLEVLTPLPHEWPNQTPVRMTGLRPARPELSVEQDALAAAAIVLEALYASVKWELAPAMKEQIAVAVLKVRKALGVGK